MLFRRLPNLFAAASLVLLLAIASSLSSGCSSLAPLALIHAPAITPEIIRFVPRQSAGFVALSTSLTRLRQLQQFTTPLGRSPPRQTAMAAVALGPRGESHC